MKVYLIVVVDSYNLECATNKCFASREKAKKYCDPHFKLDKCDSNCESFGTKEELIYGRIYFNFGDPEVANGKLLVGWIGKHA